MRQWLIAQVGAEDDQFVRGGGARWPARLRCGPGPVVAVRDPGGDVEGDRILEGPGQHGDAELRPARGPRGHRDRAQVEQIAEVRVDTDPGVHPDRIGGDLRDRRLCRGRGCEQRVRAGQAGQRASAQPLQRGEIRDEPVRRHVAGRTDDRADRGVHRMGSGVDEFAYRGVSFGDQRAVVQQPGRGQEGFRIHRDDPRAGVPQSPHRPFEGLVPQRIQIRQCVEHGHHGFRRRGEPHVGRPGAITRVRREHGHRPIRQVEVRGEDRQAIVGPAGRNHALGRHRPDGRLDTDDSLERRRNPTRTGGIGADGDIGLAARDRYRGTRTRTARDEFGPPQVVDRAVRGPGADQPGGELIQIRLAHHDRAGRTQGRDRGCIPLGGVGELRTPCGGGHSGDVDIVLHGQPQAGELAPGARELRGDRLPGRSMNPHGHGLVSSGADLAVGAALSAGIVS